MEEVQAYVQHIIYDIRGGTTDEACAELKKKGVEVFRSEARLISSHEVVVTGESQI